ncbi:MAG: hypothetical protein KGZ25_02205 [Planctomycetes bacterium]|nr:hypothetical protein [Planctomycetota bacterium]
MIGAGQFLFGGVLLLAFGAFLIFESVIEGYGNLTIAGGLVSVFGAYVLFAKRRTINRARLIKAVTVVPLVFGSVFTLAGGTGLLMGFRPHPMVSVSMGTARIEIVVGVVLIVMAAAWSLVTRDRT